MHTLDIRTPATRSEVGPWPDLADSATRAELTPAAVRGLVRLAGAWHLTTTDVTALLGGIAPSTWHAWKRTAPAELTMDQLTRISLLLGIYTALHVLHAGPLADAWVSRPNTNALFAGRTPLAAMCTGGIPVLIEVRALLDGRRGGL